MEMIEKINRYILSGVILGMTFGGVIGYLVLVPLMYGDQDVATNKLEVYECFQAIRDSEHAVWKKFWIKEDLFDANIFVIYRVISNSKSSVKDGLKAYQLRNTYKDGLKSTTIIDGDEVIMPYLICHYKDNIGYIKLKDKSGEFTISVNARSL